MPSFRATPIIFLCSDVFTLFCCVVAAVLLRVGTGGVIDAMEYWRLAPGLGIFPVLFGALGLYPGIMLSPPDELKKISWAISLVFLGLMGVIFFIKGGEDYSRLALIWAWCFSLVAVPYGRMIMRRLFARRSWWGYPLVMVGEGEGVDIMVSNIRLKPRIGLKPVAMLDVGGCSLAEKDNSRGLPRYGMEQAPELAGKYPGAYAMVSLACMDSLQKQDVLTQLGQTFTRVILIPGDSGGSSLWVTALDVGGMLGLMVRQNLLDEGRLRTKRLLDVFLALGFIAALAPLLGVIALAIKLESKGPVFFRQERLGQGGERITIWKFRTMVPNADEVLHNYLQENPALRAEWEAEHKLRHDPRITRVGRWLRLTSLDELPQLWNVLKGDLSTVGPRPIVDAEVVKYKDVYAYYTRVKPGLTGLWQVSGRSTLSYDQRIDLDRYYICNWSIWFDIYILVKTIPEVLRARGAY